MSSYQTDAVRAFKELADSITTHIDTSSDAPGTVSFLQGLRDTCLDEFVTYDIGLCGATEDEHTELLYDNAVQKLAEWSVRASDDLYWVRQQLERDLPGVPVLHNALLDNTRTKDPDVDNPDEYVATTNRVRALLCELDVRLQHSGLSLRPVFHAASTTDEDDFVFDTLETPQSGLPVEVAYGNRSPLGYVFIIQTV